MNDMQLFATFGHPAIAITLSLLGLWAGKRSADRIDAAEAARAARESDRRRPRSAGCKNRPVVAHPGP